MAIEFFKPNDFINPICIGEMKSVFERIAGRANELLVTRKELLRQLLRSEGAMKVSTDWEKLRFVSFKLRSIGHLIETQDPDHVRPDDLVDVQQGLSQLINELSAEILNVSREIEDFEIKAEKKK